MKKIIGLIALSILLVTCKSETSKNTEANSVKTNLSVAERIANAHGFEQWNTVSELSFTFNVDQDSSHFERSWTWQSKTNDVTLISGTDTISFNRNNLDSLSIKHDRDFVNDKYWLLVPFQLVWDQSAKISEPTKATAPISNTLLNKITITYSEIGGYTPGDAYDIFYDDDYVIKEWIFRRQNAEEPSLVNTFENYVDIKGLKFAQDHKQKEVNWNLNFTNIKVKN